MAAELHYVLFDQLKYIFSLIYLIYFLSKLSIFRTEKKISFYKYTVTLWLESNLNKMLQKEKLESLECIICFSFKSKCVYVCVRAWVHCRCLSVTNLFLSWLCILDYFILQIIRKQFLWSHKFIHVGLCLCGFVYIVDVSVSPIYFCDGFAFWIILFEET